MLLSKSEVVTPVGKNILVQPEELSAKIALPKNADPSTLNPIVVVIAAGDDCKVAREGDRVMLNKHAANGMTIINDTQFIVDECFILAKVAKAEKVTVQE